MKKRILSTLLALCMVLTLLPGTAWAAKSDTEPAVSHVEDSSTAEVFDSKNIRINARETSDTSVAYPVTGGNIYFDPTTGAISGSDIDITSATIPSSINGVNVTSIRWGAFSGRKVLSSVSIPNGIITIGSSAFKDCTSLKSVSIPDSVTSVEFGAFSGCIELSNLSVPASVIKLGGDVFKGCNKLVSAGPIGGGYNYEFGWLEEIPQYAFEGCDGLSSVVIPDSITRIANYAFDDCVGLVSIHVPGSVTYIGDCAFRGCSKLTNIAILSDTTIIRPGAFSGCSGITTAGPIGGGYDYEFAWTQELPTQAFSGCSNLRSISIPDSITVIGESAFSGCDKLTSVELPRTLNRIGREAFYGCSKLTNVNIPNGTYSIGKSAFGNCVGLVKVTIPESVQYTGESSGYAFAGCSGLTTAGPVGGGYNYEFGWTEKIPDYAFAGCINLQSAMIPDGITYIGKLAFCSCEKLEKLTVPGSASFGTDSLWLCSGLTSAGPIGSGCDYEYGWTDSIPRYAFHNCNGLIDATVANGITTIAMGAFEECNSLESVNIPKSVASIGNAAFYKCDGLTDVYYGGSKESWEKISIEANNTSLTNANIHYTIETDNDLELDDKNTNWTVNVGETLTLTAQSADGSAVDASKLTWTIDPALGTAEIVDRGQRDEKTAYVTLKGISPGKVTLHGTLAVGESILDYPTVSQEITVIGQDNISFTQSSYSVNELESIDIPVTVPNTNGLTLSDVTFTSSDETVATVTVKDQFALNTGSLSYTLSAKGKKAGTVTITASATDGRSATCRVTVQKLGTPGGDHNPNGFASERDGWSIGNIEFSFGYPENYRIPFSRYYDVFGISLSSLFLSGADSILKWGGNCFGLSLLAAANYNNQIDLSTCFSENSGRGLYNYGHNEIKMYGGKQCFTISGNDTAIETIEMAHISQFSQEFKKARVFENDSSYSNLLNYLKGDAPKPILVKMLPCHHAVVIDTSVKPYEVFSGEPGWYYVKLYDPNSPAPSESLSNPVWWYAKQSPNLCINPNSGRFQYWRYGKCVGEYAYKSLFDNIEFYDVSKLGTDYFTKPLKTFGNLKTIQFASNDIQILNDSNEIMFEVKDGSVIALADGCEYSPYLAGDNDTLVGIVTIPSDDFSYLSNVADVIIWSEENYYTISNSNMCKINVDMDGQSVGVYAEDSTKVNLLVQKNGTYGYNAFAIDTTLKNDESVAIAVSSNDGVKITSSGSENLTVNMDSSKTDTITTVVTDANDIKVDKKDDEFLIYSDTDGDGIYETPIETTPVSKTYTVSFDPNGGTISGSTQLTTGADGKLPNLPSAYRSGYTFTGWHTSDGTRITADTIFYADTTVYAHWSYNGGGSSSGSGSSSSGGGSSSGSSYNINIPSNASGGTVRVSPNNAGKGTTVTVTAIPNTGYKLDKLTVTDSKGNELKLTDKGNGKFQFTMPASKVGVNAAFVKAEETPTQPTAPISNFTDVPSGSYYYDAVAWAVEKGITVGTSATTFSPDASCTRAQTVTFLWRAAGSPAPSGGVNPFTDVQPGTYYYDAVLWAAEQGITSGTSVTTFSPDATVTRGQTVTFLYRAAGSPATSGNNSFGDITSDAYYASAVQWAESKGVTAGTSATTFSPDSNCTRAQIVTFLYRNRAN